MNFNSLEYLVFFIGVVAVYFTISARWRWIFLLLASYYFYMCAKPAYVIFLATSTLLNYWMALRIGQTNNRRDRKKYLTWILIFNVGFLFGVKYLKFSLETLKDIFQPLNVLQDFSYLNILAPIGISFYTFQAIGYLLDVYWNKRKPETHLGMFALYLSFFPQVVSGPIGRSTELLPQFYKEQHFEYERVVDGLRLILWGFFKKLVMADRMAFIVNDVYARPYEFVGIPILFATYLFAFQLYLDFSGYSDIAIGSARVLGYKLRDNFRRPYLAQSISDFWSRWHMSLTSWLGDYFYRGLGGTVVRRQRWYFNIMCVFVLSGLWHGANWTYVVWGALFGFYYLMSFWTTGIRRKCITALGLDRCEGLHRIIRIVITFHMVLLGWFFFRANSLQDAFYMITHCWGFHNLVWHIQMRKADIIFSIFWVVVLFIIEWIQERGPIQPWFVRRPVVLRWAVYYATIFGIVILGNFNLVKFFYFQF